MRTLTLIILSASILFARSVSAVDSDAGAKKPLFLISVMKDKDPEYGLTIYKNVLATDNYKLIFETPRNWRLEADETEQKVIFSSRDTAAVMYFKIQVNNDPTNVVEMPKLEDLRAAVLAERSGAEIKSEFQVSVRGMRGQGFRLDYEGKSQYTEKVIWVASKVGLIEYDLRISGPPKFAESDFNSLLNSFVLEPVKVSQSASR